ncbi:TraB/GumN family protein [Mesorhizobium sp. YIM 152430]|uniref:TraB/GumN family protein n=1 Tax=Mesorhizobium sp. YIM 152430 TaxID=3031761 RepID=UPI0023D9C980|nr:TraB/GumN family protein [Mesorhizobium sp. YIM 152430]MDF1599455.1 TraB/GumN family protein [Mesorhizobium sp. YIM 152430]
MLMRLDPDRLADTALRLLAALTTLAFASFTLILFAGIWAAQAEAVCTGDDLLAIMERDDPAAYARLLDASAETPNGEAMLWRIETPEGAVSHLYGTMHVTDPRIAELDTEAGAAFDASGTLVIETTDILDPAAMMATMATHPDLMMFTDATTLSSLLGRQDRVKVEAAMTERGMSLASLDKMKPWMIAAMVTLPTCELARKSAGAEILDVALATRAETAGMKIEGLETTAEQLGAMAALPLDFHIRALVETLAMGETIDDVIETMIVIHRRGAPGLYWPFFEAALPGDGSDGVAIAGFEQSVIVDRNRTMAERMKPLLDAGGAFVAIGALHLPGEEGVVALLERSGYSATPIPVRK